MTRKVCLAQEPEADALLAGDYLALLFGMLLDQHVAECMTRAWNRSNM
ncbi:hypothetical protein [Kutzneria buriramensis]|nr:hypothetical protein [Kutzneria buriramensis]